jgi:hypothetical protein
MWTEVDACTPADAPSAAAAISAITILELLERFITFLFVDEGSFTAHH